MTTVEILLIAAIVLIALACIWFFVIHKHVSTIHIKVDSILNTVKNFARPPGMGSVGTPIPQEKKT